MIPELDIPKSPHSFEDADGLISYMEHRLRSKTGFVSRLHFAQLAYLAELDLTKLDVPLNKEDIKQNWLFVSLRQHDCCNVIAHVRKRIAEEKIPDNWFREFTKFMDNQPDSQPIAREV